MPLYPMPSARDAAATAAAAAPAPCLLTVVSPTFNEAENISPFVAAICQAVPQLSYEILIVDDDSPDGTWRRVAEVAQSDKRVRVLRRTCERSLSASVIDGFSAATGDIVACIDCDLQHDPAILPRMIEELLAGADVVVGSRYVPGGGVSTKWSVARRLGSVLATRLAQMAIGARVLDPMSGFFVMRRRDFDRIKDALRPTGFKILLEIVAAFPACHVREVPYTFVPRKHGESKMSPRVAFSYFGQVLRLALRRRSRASRQSA